jgi:hypothetical protein
MPLGLIDDRESVLLFYKVEAERGKRDDRSRHNKTNVHCTL